MGRGARKLAADPRAVRLRPRSGAMRARDLGRRPESISYTVTIEETGDFDDRGSPRVRVRARRDDLQNLFGPVRWLTAAGGGPVPLGIALEELAGLIAAEQRQQRSSATRA